MRKFTGRTALSALSQPAMALEIHHFNNPPSRLAVDALLPCRLAVWFLGISIRNCIATKMETFIERLPNKACCLVRCFAIGWDDVDSLRLVALL